MDSFIVESINKHIETINFVREQSSNILKISQICTNAIRCGNKILFCGNGGSSSDSQHLAGELMGRLKGNRRSLPALALTADTAVITCIGNDYGYDEIFSRQVEGIGHSGDILIGISTSGNSGNVIRAIEAANLKEIITIGFLGGSGGKMKDICKNMVCIDSTKDTARIQEAHILIGHILCGLIEKQLGLVE